MTLIIEKQSSFECFRADKKSFRFIADEFEEVGELELDFIDADKVCWK